MNTNFIVIISKANFEEKYLENSKVLLQSFETINEKKKPSTKLFFLYTES